MDFLWTSVADLPCGCEGVHGVWSVGNATFSCLATPAVDLELRGPLLWDEIKERTQTNVYNDSFAPAHWRRPTALVMIEGTPLLLTKRCMDIMDRSATRVCDEPHLLRHEVHLRENIGHERLGVQEAPLTEVETKSDDVGPVIALALLSESYWEMFGSKLKGQKSSMYCGTGDVDAPIRVKIDDVHGQSWKVDIVQPVRFHLIRHLAYCNDAEFCVALRQSFSFQPKGGKSKAHFWSTPSGKMVIKEINLAEARQLDKVLPESLITRLATAAGGGDSAMSEVFGLFSVKSRENGRSRGIMVMRDVKYGICDDEGEWEYFDVKGVGSQRSNTEMTSRQRSTTMMTSRRDTMDSEFGEGTWQMMDEGAESVNPGTFWNALPRMSSAAASFDPDDIICPPAEAPGVSWDHGFMQALGGLPFPLQKADYDRLLKSLDDDTEVLESIASVDYSLLVALNRGSSEETGIIRMGLIDYLQPYNTYKRIESAYKKTVVTSNPTVINPSLYRKRFCEFMKQAFEPDPA